MVDVVAPWWLSLEDDPDCESGTCYVGCPGDCGCCPDHDEPQVETFIYPVDPRPRPREWWAAGGCRRLESGLRVHVKPDCRCP